ncbi:uncharacterized protein LOC108671661 isoform X1 [Hyalella azteca]|uniref:Uncharacterized protein LOC108671661 isoform X1 n=1 Tax=Hyalella azteca TaxID=294128 RepID=A0A8B7NNH8_HYAAZ|nr:uncharacterized protein LOC108671661 isoform X2 [Hyalella azteca]XP_047737043.1 uncharacterized protein LOC108671661 isoform X1 [Hyalella azteca]
MLKPSNDNRHCSLAVETFIKTSLGVATLVVGVQNIERCNIDPLIPIMLIVNGVWYLTSVVLELVLNCCVLCTNKPGFVLLLYAQKAVFSLLFLAIVVTDNVFVFTAWREGPDYYNLEQHKGCDQTTFVLSMVLVILADITLCLAVLVVACVCCCFSGALLFVTRPAREARNKVQQEPPDSSTPRLHEDLPASVDAEVKSNKAVQNN